VAHALGKSSRPRRRVGTENLIRIDCVTESRDNVRQTTKAPTVSLRRMTIPAFHRKRSPFDV
jgi:hypothetical protein